MTCSYDRCSFRGIGLAALLLFLLAVPGWSQSGTGSVRGTVQDSTSAVIPGATIRLVNTATSIEQRTTTNDVGIYVFPSVVPGPYRIEAESPGMNNYTAAVTVQTQVSAVVDIVLQPGGTQTTISVLDVTPVVTTDAPSLSTTLERTRIEQLPINGRNIMNLLNTVPGLGFDTNNVLRTFGTRQGTHDLMLDGAAFTEPLWAEGTLNRPPNLESIQEFHAETNSASARYARQANIVMTTRGGTNEIHGSLFATNRNSGYGVARTRDNFTNTAAKLNRNEYGGSVGGPIWLPRVYDGRNRTFFFFSHEGMKLRSGGYGNYRVPTQAMRDGDFSGLVTAAGTRITIYDPLTTGADYSRQPFNYGGTLNRIDPSRISPLTQYLYSILPLPTLPDVNPLVGNNFSAPAPDMRDQYSWSARFDHRFSDQDSIYVRLTNANSNWSLPAGGGVPTLDGFGNSRRTWAPNKSISGTWTRSFSPTLFSETVVSATRNIREILSGERNRQYATELGLPNPGGQPGYPVINSLGVTTSGNYFSPPNWNLQYFNYFIADNNTTKLWGRHEFQFGVHLRHDQLNYMPQQQRTAGSVTFQALTTALYDPRQSTATNRVATLNTGHVAAAAYLGYANYEVRAAKGMYYMRQNESALYFQDNWRATNRLTLNLGLRWQFSPYPNDKHNVFSSFDPKTMSIVLGRDLETLYRLGATSPALVRTLEGYGARFITAREAGLPEKLAHNNWRDIGPHLGLAYRALDGAKSFVIRGGFSTSYFPLPIYGWNDRMRLNAPFSGFYQNYSLTDGAQSPDGIANYGLVSVPSTIAGRNSANAVDFDNPRGITVGGDSFRAAYFDPHQPSSRVHDWNLTVEKEILRDTALRIGYVGNRSTHQDSYDSWNQTIPDYVWYMTNRTQLPTGAWAAAQRRPNPTYPYGDLQESLLSKTARNSLFWAGNSFVLSGASFGPGGGLRGRHDPVQNG